MQILIVLSAKILHHQLRFSAHQLTHAIVAVLDTVPLGIGISTPLISPPSDPTKLVPVAVNTIFPVAPAVSEFFVDRFKSPPWNVPTLFKSCCAVYPVALVIAHDPAVLASATSK